MKGGCERFSILYERRWPDNVHESALSTMQISHHLIPESENTRARDEGYYIK